MKILIIENEVYLAQSIATKLTEIGHNCEICTSAREAMQHDKVFDVILLSTGINSTDLTPLIQEFKESIIILMVSYISNDTVSKPLSAGAKDYIVKPFMIEELIRKIKHHREHEKLKQQNNAFKKYFDHTFCNYVKDFDFENVKLPVFILTSSQRNADAFAYAYSKSKDTHFTFIDVSTSDGFDDLKNSLEDEILYIVGFNSLKKFQFEEFYSLVGNKEAIISISEKNDNVRFEVIEFKMENDFLAQGEILPIEDYVKYIVLNYQHKYPDTELSKKLGISRKSLWEKRKKYDIIKKK